MEDRPTMKLHFEADLDYQIQAIEAVCDLFRGQEICRNAFTVTHQALDDDQTLDVDLDAMGIGNKLTLFEEDLLANLREVQLRNGLRQCDSAGSRNFTVEMETGTGKTYVYLRTILELNKRYGFTKFVIVVPSVAIKEGVYSSLRTMKPHFDGLYASTPFDYYLYDSSKLDRVRDFATSSQIRIMITTIGAINKQDVNNLYKESDKISGSRPIDLIKATRPIVIVDEPQSVDGGPYGRGREALDRMQPLCTLRYSATHAEKHSMVYRLDAVDAYERKLVKQIEVASATIEYDFGGPFVELLNVSHRVGDLTARIAVNKQTAREVRRAEVTVRDGDDLEETTGLAAYRNFRIGEIRADGSPSMELRLPGQDVQILTHGQSWGGIEPLTIQRHMIRRTIKEHLDKELKLRPQGIKVLSLFFIDEVARYRVYLPDGTQAKGVYAEIFEEEYRRLTQLPEYRTLFSDVDLESTAEQVHGGYFSIDKQQRWQDTDEKSSQAGRDNAERAYALIMQKKEELLSLSTPLKFIFSHSALREGWDNPNVFQICTLRDIRSESERRQTIGRGLRLCVNQQGDRVRGFDVNTLTVIATESYEQFAERLQKEIEEDTGIRFGIVEQHEFASLNTTGADGHPAALGFERSKALWDHLRAEGYISGRGRIEEKLRTALRKDHLFLPAEFDEVADQARQHLHKLAGQFTIKNADERREVSVRHELLHSPEFIALWDRISPKTTYRLDFDNERLIAACTRALREAPAIPKARLQWRKAGISVAESGVTAQERAGAEISSLDNSAVVLPDVLTELQDRTHLTRRSIYRILTESGRLDDFRRNPQRFIDLAAQAINRCKQLAVVDGISYERRGAEAYSLKEFDQHTLTGYLRNMLSPTAKSVYEMVLHDSTVERDFATELELNTSVKVYAKLPDWFRIRTPLGDYNPDWAVVADSADGDGMRLYLVVETKGGLHAEGLRPTEQAKIDCGKAHFDALGKVGHSVVFKKAVKLEDVLG
ncbi:type III restriction-modification system endonuclease [Streptomyces sp. NPDC003719]